MRYSIHLLWLVPLLGAAALGADDLPQPKKDPAASTPAPFPSLPAPRPSGAAADADTAELQRLLRDLRSQREALQKDRSAAEHAPAPPGTLSSNDAEIARLRQRMQELASRGARRTEAGPPTLLRPADVSTTPSGGTADGGPLDPVAVARNYYRAGDYEAALAAYRKVPLRDSLAEERAPVLYMVATCLRKLGKRDEAVKVYRDVAGIKGDPFVADCAQWQLQTLSWRADVDAQLAQVRERRKGLQPRP